MGENPFADEQESRPLSASERLEQREKEDRRKKAAAQQAERAKRLKLLISFVSATLVVGVILALVVYKRPDLVGIDVRTPPTQEELLERQRSNRRQRERSMDRDQANSQNRIGGGSGFSGR